MPPQRPARRSTRLLQASSVAFLGLGTLLFLPLGGVWGGPLPIPSWLCAIVMLSAGVAGVMGLTFTWYRALISFTMLAWAVALVSIIQFVVLIINCVHHSCNGNPLAWLFWLASLLSGVPAAVLSSTMHILRVWRPAPLVSDTSEPLVSAAADEPLPAPRLHQGSAAAAAAGGGASRPPAWPPANTALGTTSGAGLSTSDFQAAARVASAAHSGTGAFSANDLNAAARVGAAAANVWPPPARATP